MKTTLLSFSLLLAAGLLTASTTHAQQAVANGTLETWATRNGGDVPTQWLTTDDAVQQVLSGLPATGAVTKSTDRHAGSFAAKLTTAQTLISLVPGVVAIGTKLGNFIGGTSFDALGGLPYTSRAARMQFYYKFTGTIATPADRPVASVSLTRTVGGVRQTVASGSVYLTPAATYTLGDLPLTYTAGTTPDSIHIAFSSADYNVGIAGFNSFTAGNTLFVDDIVMVGTVTATRDPQLQAAVSVYPNPSTNGRFTLAAAKEASLLTGAYTVTDALGRVVAQQAAAPANATGSRPVDLRTQPAGVYSLRLDTPRGPVVQQLLIQ